MFKLILASVLLLLCGCSLFRGSLKTEKDFHERSFEYAFNYFCKYRSWPETFEQLAEYAGEDSGSKWRNFYPAAKLSSERLVTSVLSFESQSKTKSKAAVRQSVTFIAPASCGADLAEGVTPILGDGLQLILPNGFPAMTGQQMKDRWGKGPYPDVAWLNQGSGLKIIALRFGETKVIPTKLEQFRKSLEIAYENATPDIDWISRLVATKNNRNWIDFAFESSSSKGRLYNRSLSTSFRGKLLTFSLVAAAEERLAIDSVTEKLIENLKLID